MNFAGNFRKIGEVDITEIAALVDKFTEADWDTALQAAADGILAVIGQQGPEQLGVLVAPTATLEEMLLAAPPPVELNVHLRPMPAVAERTVAQIMEMDLNQSLFPGPLYNGMVKRT